MPKTETELTVERLAYGLANTSGDTPQTTITLKQINFCLPDEAEIDEEEAHSILSAMGVNELAHYGDGQMRRLSVISSVEVDYHDGEIRFVVTFRREFSAWVEGIRHLQLRAVDTRVRVAKESDLRHPPHSCGRT